MASISENISALRHRIGELESRYGRPQGSVRLLAVSKQQPAAAIRQAWAGGQKDFGESYLNEALEKMEELANADIRWHFIGPLQSNKTRGIASHFSWVHSLDREKTARRLNEQRPGYLPPLNVCVQVNSSGEASKSGVTPEETLPLCQAIAAMPKLRLRGLMAIPAPANDFSEQRQAFHELARLYFALQLRFPDFDTLSMGMSGDYEAAIAEGSTLVRIGAAVFGARTPPAKIDGREPDAPKLTR